MKAFCFGVFCAPLITAAVSDAKTMKIPDSMCILLLLAGAGRLFTTGPPDGNAVLMSVGGLLIGGIPLLAASLMTGGIGGGDIKLAASAGFFLGFSGSYLALLGALILFLAACTVRRIIWKISFKTPFPFGPFYAAAGIGAYVLLEVMK